ncbi:hypothetical protein [Rummeliibacillus stabekisii]|uniref:Uncharacterized protein n=1 Tax=Rummeliibacillus stabekisii TaxID=241244 RepID=A0A143HEK7_9BACL|nr:hypothetical protein [Rummeliibacillus stabekisii]AMW99906.1 hypothetical protein ATY39_11020 [Rummeliibacillus stabekisii]
MSRRKVKTTKDDQRNIWQDYLDVAEDLRYYYEIQAIYEKRKEKVERIVSGAKENWNAMYNPEGP